MNAALSVRTLLFIVIILVTSSRISHSFTFAGNTLVSRSIYQPSFTPLGKGKNDKFTSGVYSKRNPQFDRNLHRHGFVPNRSIGKSLAFKNFPATSTIIFLNAATFLAAYALPSLKVALMKIDHRVDRGETYRLITSLFIHGGISHLIFNSLSLYRIGPQVEKIFGRYYFLLLYFGSGLIANIITYFLRTSPFALGSSGSTFGLMGALATYLYLGRNALGNISVSGLNSIKQNLLINVLIGLSSNNIDHIAHLGGFGGGLLLAYIIMVYLKRDPVAWVSRLLGFRIFSPF